LGIVLIIFLSLFSAKKGDLVFGQSRQQFVPVYFWSSEIAQEIHLKSDR